MAAGKETALVHQALVYSSDDEFLTVTVPFLHAGLTAADAVLVAASPARLDRLRRTLGPAAAPVLFVDARQWYHHPVRTLAAYEDFLRARAPQPVRVLADLDWTGSTAAQVREWMRYEALVNAAFGSSEVRAMCAYARDMASPGLLSEVRRTHREMVEGGRPRHNADYTEPGLLFAEYDREPLPLPPVFDSIPIESADLHDVRAFVAARAGRHGLPEDALSRLLVAVTELATNAVRYGSPPMAVRLWATDGDLICEVADCGVWRPRPAATLGFAPPPAGVPPGFGIWGVRMLADTVQIRAGWDGTVVRLSMGLTG